MKFLRGYNHLGVEEDQGYRQHFHFNFMTAKHNYLLSSPCIIMRFIIMFSPHSELRKLYTELASLNGRKANEFSKFQISRFPANIYCAFIPSYALGH
jgi:hypothetical protein